jgi:hypothetical protein
MVIEISSYVVNSPFQYYPTIFGGFMESDLHQTDFDQQVSSVAKATNFKGYIGIIGEIGIKTFQDLNSGRKECNFCL